MENEKIDWFNLEFHQNNCLESTRRNSFTKNVNLNDLVAKKFRIGAMVCMGIELCEACDLLARN